MERRCSKCGYQNAETMRFCLNCGMQIPEAQPPINNLPTGGNFPGLPTERKTESFNNPAFLNSTPNFPPSQPTILRPKSGSSSKILLIGGVISLFVLLATAGAAIVFYNLKPGKTDISDTTPTPASSNTRTIVSKPIATPFDSPTPDAAPQVSFTPPTQATARGSFTVYANGGWQLSPIDVVPLERFRTSAQGLIDLSGIKTSVSSGGVTDPKNAARRIYPEYPTGALLMRTRFADGKYSNVQPVTAAPSKGMWQNFPDERGKLEFCVNDNAPNANGGQLVVSVTMTSVPKVKK